MRNHPLFRMAAVLSALLLGGTYICYRAGAIEWPGQLFASAPPPEVAPVGKGQAPPRAKTPPAPAVPPAPAPVPLLMPGTKSAGMSFVPAPGKLSLESTQPSTLTLPATKLANPTSSAVTKVPLAKP